MTMDVDAISSTVDKIDYLELGRRLAGLIELGPGEQEALFVDWGALRNLFTRMKAKGFYHSLDTGLIHGCVFFKETTNKETYRKCKVWFPNLPATIVLAACLALEAEAEIEVTT